MGNLAHLARRLLAPRAVRSIVEIEGGVDHAVFEIDGELLLRRQRQPDGRHPEALDREVRLLTLVAGVSPIPVPEVVAVEPESGVGPATE